MLSLPNLVTFIHVATAGSFAEAAVRMGVSTSATSKAVQRLEEELGVKLFHRTTRSVSLTTEGERLFEGSQRLVDEVEALTAEVTDSRRAPRGRIVVSAPAVFGRVWLTDKILDFMKLYPEVEVEVNFDDRIVDLAAEGIDLAVRLGALSDSANLVVRKLFDDTIYTCAAPEYLAAHGIPETIEGLTRHRCIHYRVRTTGRLFPFHFQRDDRLVRQAFTPTLVLNSVDAMRRAAERGLGVTQLPSFLALDALRTGRLTELLPALRMSSFPYNLVYLDRRLVSRRVRALVDFLASDPPRFDR